MEGEWRGYISEYFVILIIHEKWNIKVLPDPSKYHGIYKKFSLF